MDEHCVDNATEVGSNPTLTTTKILNFSVNNSIPSERRDFKPVEKNIGFSVKQEATAL